MAVPTGIEPAISCVTGRHVNRYTTGPLICITEPFKKMAEEEGFEPPHGLTRLSVFKTDPFSRTWVFLRNLVEPSGIEPLTSCVQGRRSPS